MCIYERIDSATDNLLSEMVRWRRHIHSHPGISYDTKETEEYIRKFLQKAGIEILDSSVGVLARITSLNEKAKGVIILRADIDALPLDEQNDVDYKSVKKGAMHACGHDGHTSMLMGTAHILAENRELLPHDVILMFQPAEEGPLPGGAKYMLDDIVKLGIIKDVKAAFALHLSTEYPVGTINLSSGSTMSSTDEFYVRIKGLGGHAGLPHKSIDALSIAARFVMEMESFMYKRISPFDPAVFSIGILKAGSAINIVPEYAELSGTIRCQQESTREFIMDSVKVILDHLCGPYNADYDLKLKRGLPVLVNDSKAVKLVEKCALSTVGSENVRWLEHSNMGAEDFSHFSQVVPVAYTWIGARNEEKGFVHLMHNPKFDFDEDALAVGTKLLCRISMSAF